jgi:hypothetical protein
MCCVTIATENGNLFFFSFRQSPEKLSRSKQICVERLHSRVVSLCLDPLSSSLTRHVTRRIFMRSSLISIFCFGAPSKTHSSSLCCCCRVHCSAFSHTSTHARNHSCYTQRECSSPSFSRSPRIYSRWPAHACALR